MNARLVKVALGAVLGALLATAAATPAPARAYVDEFRFYVTASGWWYAWVGTLGPSRTIGESTRWGGGYYIWVRGLDYDRWYAAYVYSYTTGTDEWNFYYSTY